jgi:geranylgeranyl pyrophosphate synthase
MHLEEAIQATDALMAEIVASDISVLEEASRHILRAGGKRVRPRVLFLAFQAVGGQDFASAVPLAAAIELVHTATLVHDDINDHGTTRRGQATVNERWGRTFALLTGDFLFAKVYTLMAPYKDLNKILAEATVALVEGETLQASAAKNNGLNRETYQQIVARKTASLFRAAALLGATHGGGYEKAVDALGEYGFYLGLVFQIIDDLLDLTGDPRLMGKQVGVDLTQGKGVGSVYAANYGKNNGRANADTAVLAESGPESNDGDDPLVAIKRRLIAGGAIDEGRQMAHMLAIQAGNSLDKLPDTEAVGALRDLITTVLDRRN